MQDQTGRARVYVAKFTAKDGGECFIKVGISGQSMSARFAADLKIYMVELLAEGNYYRRSDALIVEGNIHELFRHRRQRPSIPLRSDGNTECFAISILDDVLKVMAGVPVRQAEPKPVIVDHRTRGERRRASRRKRESSVRQGFSVPHKNIELFAMRSVKKYGERRSVLNERVSRYRPDGGVMFKAEEEKFIDDLREMRHWD